MSPPSRKTWSQLARLSNKECKYDSTTTGASSKQAINTAYQEPPIRKRRKTNLPQECTACPHHHEKPGLSRPDCRTRNASTIQQRRVLHRKGRSSRSSRSTRRPYVYPRIERGKVSHVRKGPQSRNGLKFVAQKNRPHQSPKTSEHAIERSRNWTPELYDEGDYTHMRSMSVWKAMPSPIH